jgi:gamma-glutamylputrescine oxidase
MSRPSLIAPSYYQASASPIPTFPTLHGDATADVLIIGAGFTGLSAALELAEAGYKVVVLEAGTVGSGASGRNGGQICTGFSPGQAKLESQLGAQDAQKCFAMAEDAKTLIEHRIEKYAISCDLQWGYLHCATKPNQIEGLKTWRAEMDALNYDGCSVLSKGELEEKLGTRNYFGALREARAGHFHPLKYCLGLAHAAVAAGAQIFEQSRALAIETGAHPGAQTEHGNVSAKFLILAGNAYLGKTAKPLYGRVMPVSSFMVSTEPLRQSVAQSLIRDNEAVADTNFILDYFRRTPDHRLLFGGAANYSTLEPGDVGAFMKRRMIKVFPQLQGAKIEFAWGGYIAITSNRLPACGFLSPTTLYAHGYSGQGVALAGMYGKLMAETIRGQSEQFDLLARIKHLPFPGGAARTPLLVAAMLYYRLKDILG